jgi:hypothetical protein
MAIARLAVLAWCGILALSPASVGAATTTTVVDVPTRGVTQRFLYIRPDAPVANIVDIPGGDGVLGIADDGTLTTLVGECTTIGRARDQLVALGFGVVLVDEASDHQTHRYDDIREVLRYLRSRDSIPNWIVGGSSSTRAVVNVAATLPLTEPLGLIAFSPQLPMLDKAPLVKRPALVIYNTLDTADLTWGSLFAALTSAPARELVALTGGPRGGSGCTAHTFYGIEDLFVASITGFIDKYNALTAPPTADNYQGLWWGAPAGVENGWGINFAHQGNVIFGTWFTYDTTGKGWWLTLITDSNPSPGVYSANLFLTTGPPFNAVPFNKTSGATKVGIATLNFTDASNGTFHYEVTLPGGTVSQTKAITQQQLAAPPLASCASATQPLTAATNYQDIWWAGTSANAGTEPGWGINFTHQGDIVFASWFTYDLDGTPLWVVATAAKIAPGIYKGDLYRPSGPRFDSYDKNQWTANPSVGTLTLTFADGNNATMDYTLLDLGPQHKIITRQLFSAGTTCH